MKILRIFATIIAGLTASLAIVFLASYFGLIPGVRTYIVLSGSMEPAIRVGSLAMVAPQKTYLENEIISYSPDGNQENVITHRIISKQYPEGIHQTPIYLTAGDANPYFDKNLVKENQVLGKAVFALPYLGIWANFVKQPLGFILFVIVPATIIVWEELRNIQKESKKIYQKIREKQSQETNPLSKEKRGFNQGIIALPIFAAALALTSLSLSVFSDREMSGGNSFVAGEWAIATPTPTPTPSSATDHLVINEVYYDVDDKTYGDDIEEEGDNEWIEIYNPTNTTVDISGWIIEENQGSSYQRTIPSSSPIPAYGYALIAPEAATWSYWPGIPPAVIKIVLGISIGNGLANASDRVILLDDDENEIDAMSYGSDTYAFSPACTDVAEGHSLERNPDGHDTDTAADFVDQTNPTPGS